MSLMGSAMENCRKWGFGPDMDGLPRKGQHFLAKQALREIRDKVGMLAHTWLQSTRLLGTLAAPPPLQHDTRGAFYRLPGTICPPAQKEDAMGGDITTRQGLTISRD